MDAHRSFERITRADLRRLARIAAEERADFFSRHREYAILYAKRWLGSVLTSNAALHYLNGVTGVREFSVWSFYALHPEAAFPFQRPSHADFGKSKFGRMDDGPDGYVGLRVVLNGRSIDAKAGDDPIAAIQRYLSAGTTPSSRELAQKAVVLIAPEPLLGAQVWPSLALALP